MTAKPKIELKLNNSFTKGVCPISGAEFDCDYSVYFDYNNTGRAVHPDIALELGFTMSRDVFETIDKALSDSLELEDLKARMEKHGTRILDFSGIVRGPFPVDTPITDYPF